MSVYMRPGDPQRPLICLDELPVQLLDDVREPLPPAPGQVAKEDYEYQRAGTANIFLVFAPLLGKRYTKVTARRTKQDWAHWLRELLDGHFAAAEKVVIVMDNLNTHSPSSFYETFAPAEAQRLAERLEIHYTPVHGSWLNMAESELSALDRQCLDRRLPDVPMLTQEVAAWEQPRNAATTSVDWRFTTSDARIKLKRLYPSIEV